MDHSILIIGLGNIGAEYENTRHNVGFQLLDQIAKTQMVNFQKKQELKGMIARFQYAGKTVTLLKPITYMNLSGEAVRKTIDFFKISQPNILVLFDDVDVALGQFKLKSSGSSGGHNGLKSIETHLGSKDYYRIKIGVGKNSQITLSDYVLGKFEPEEKKTLEQVFKQVEPLVMAFIEKGYHGALDSLSLLRSQNANKNST